MSDRSRCILKYLCSVVCAKETEIETNVGSPVKARGSQMVEEEGEDRRSLDHALS
jgi:hypothetical protein